MRSRASAVWQGDLFGGSGSATLSSGAAGPMAVSWASRTEASGGNTSPEELIAAAHAACFAMALSHELPRRAVPLIDSRQERLRRSVRPTLDFGSRRWN